MDAGRGRHAEIFVKADSGAATQFWTIFKLVHGHIAQVTTDGRTTRAPGRRGIGHYPGRLPLQRHARFVVVGEEVAGNYTTWSYERDNNAWRGSALVLVAAHACHATSARAGAPPLAYTAVRCGDLRPTTARSVVSGRRRIVGRHGGYD